MAGNIRATFFFKLLPRGYGWTETLFTGAPDLTSAMIKAQTILPYRIGMGGQQTYLYKVRVSDDSVKRDRLIYQVPLISQVSVFPVLGDSDIANTCLNMTLAATPVAVGRTFLRGIPDGQVTNGGNFTPTALFNSLLNTWKSNLISLGFSVRFLNQPPPVGTGPAAAAINTLVFNPLNGQVLITTLTPHGLPTSFPYGLVNITGLPGFPSISGQQKVLLVTSSTGFIIMSKTLLPAYVAGGFCQKVTFVTAPITAVDFATVTHRITGRPSDGPVGRARVR